MASNHITAEDLYRLETVSDPQLSPDGRQIAFVVQRVDQETEKKYSNIWLVPAGRGRPRQFTYGDQSDSHPRWSPDGKEIAFLSNRGGDGPSQIYIIRTTGGEARPLTSLKGQIGGFDWSPDGSRLLCRLLQKDPHVVAREKDPQKKKLGTVARHYTRLRHKFDGVGFLPEKSRWHVWVIDAESGEGTQLTADDAYEEMDPAWSADGERIVFVSNRGPNPDFDPQPVDLYTIPAGGGDLTPLGVPQAGLMSPRFSPDGAWLAFIGREGGFAFADNAAVYLLPASGGEPRNLTAHHDIHVAGLTWAPDGGSLLIVDAHHGSFRLLRLSLAGEITPIFNGPGWVTSVSVGDAGDRAALLLGEQTAPFQVYTVDLDGGALQKRTRFCEAWLRRKDLGTVEEVWFKSADGDDLQGWILKPPGFDPEQTYPSILEIHGGPLGQYGHVFMHEFFYFAAQGYVVTYSNPRGGRGYGEAHAQAILGGWGEKDYADIMAWADHVAAQPYIDTARMGVTGGSYGGFLTNWIIGHTDRFAAAVTQRSISNFISQWGASDISWWIAYHLADGAPPYEALARFWDQSPLKYVGNATTPTLIIHSEQDHRCPQDQAEQLYVALQKEGVDTELVLFPDSPHGLSRVGRTDRRIARLNHMLRWFDRYLQDEAA